jgi:hypothetical protein
MKTQLKTWMLQLTTRRAIALAMGPGLLTIALDAAISHFADRPMRNPAQLTPVIFAPVACVALLAVALPRAPFKAFRSVVRFVGAAGVLVGLTGCGFHLVALGRLLEGASLTRDALVAALAVAPPVFAPAAFAGIGALVWVLGSPHLTVAYDAGRPGPRNQAAVAPRAQAA